ncbi:unnamed protein product, partial [Thlaspi arvense]
MGPAPANSDGLLVATLLRDETGEWDVGKVEGLLPLLTSKNLSIKQAKKEHQTREFGLGKAQEAALLKAPWILWSIWTAWNHKLFQERHFSKQETVVKAIGNAREWIAAQKTEVTPSIPVARCDPQTREEIVCKSDAARNANHLMAGGAWNFSRSRDGLNKSESQTFTYVKSPLAAEGLSLRAAMEQAISLNLKRISFESDWKTLIAVIKNGECISDLHGIVADVISLTCSFDAASFHFVKREKLSCVDKLAKQALSLVVPNPINFQLKHL